MKERLHRESNVLNLPSVIRFSNGHINHIVYAADGQKLKVEYMIDNTEIVSLNSIYSGEDTETFMQGGDDFEETGSRSIDLSNVTTLMTRDYCDDIIYLNDTVERVMNDYGYYQAGQYHYYVKDYQGSVRAVVDDLGDVEEFNHYYPYGALFGTSYLTAVQPLKYGAKELERENGLDWYDSRARWYDPLTVTTPTLDPLLEKYYPLSPHLWCAGNPIKYGDTNGTEVHVHSNEELLLIQNTIPEKERHFISCDKNGFIDKNNLINGFFECDDLSDNFKCLLNIVCSSNIVDFELTDSKSAINMEGMILNNNDITYPFRDVTPPDEYFDCYTLDGSIGWSLAPKSHKWTNNDLKIMTNRSLNQQYYSTSNNYKVQINSNGLKYPETYLQLIETTAHELLGHIYLMFSGQDSLHNSSPIVNDFIIRRQNEARQNILK